MMKSILLVFALVFFQVTVAFPLSRVANCWRPMSFSPQGVASSTTRLLDAATSGGTSSDEIEQFLQTQHGLFYKYLLLNNDHVWKSIRERKNGCTIFAPTNAAIEQLGEKKLLQLLDNRNEEAKNQMGSFHVIVNDVVTVEQLYNSGGIRTIATGESPIVPIERAVSGGLFGIGGKEDGTVTIGSSAQIVDSVVLRSSNCIVHQTDALISPNILWRYCDQLRIPGSK
jgi:uncharacterized surface protein with fasciclin (FAS1) repeats